MSASPGGARPLSATVVIAQSVRPEKEGEYLRWQAEINAACRTFPGFEAAEIVPPFPGPAQPALPPNWKQAMVVLLVLFPTVMVLGKALSPFLSGLPFALQMFLSNVASVALMTWLFMPVALRRLGPWLTPAGTGIGVRGLVTVLIGYAVALAVFLALG